jgi:hypothetical protein
MQINSQIAVQTIRNWRSDPALRAEFGNDILSYYHYLAASSGAQMGPRMKSFTAADREEKGKE